MSPDEGKVGQTEPYGATPQWRENVDPEERIRPLPWFLIMGVGAVTMWGAFYIADMRSELGSAYGDGRTPSTLQAAAAPLAGAPVAAIDGGQIFAGKCAACHQATGLGVPGVFPPLAASEWVLGDDKLLVQIPLHGVNGALQVKGVIYNGAMPVFNTLSDGEIAAVLSYVRSSWGNSAAPVTAETVKAGRAATAARTEPYAGGEALKKALNP